MLSPKGESSKPGLPPTPPPTPGKRRRHLRESEETDGLMTVETFIYRSDPFRASSYQVPLPFPLMIRDPGPNLQLDSEIFRPLAPLIISILEENGIPENRCGVRMGMISKLRYSGNYENLTLIVQVHQIFSITGWAKARDELRKYLVSKGYAHVGVEIYDAEKAFMPSISPLLPDNVYIQLYESKRDVVIWHCIKIQLSSQACFGSIC